MTWFTVCYLIACLVGMFLLGLIVAKPIAPRLPKYHRVNYNHIREMELLIWGEIYTRTELKPIGNTDEGRWCDKKLVFRTEEAALKYMGRIPQKGNGAIPVRVYWCQHHKGYHFTNRPKPWVESNYDDYIDEGKWW